MVCNLICDGRFPTAVDALESDEETVHFGRASCAFLVRTKNLSLRNVIADQ
jgi:hypothetical protein